MQHDRGKFKKNENMIIGANFQTVSPAETPILMFQLPDNLQYLIDNSESADEKLLAILDTHIQFEHIHPFFAWQWSNRADYIEFLGNQNVEWFFAFAEELLDKEQKRMQAFQNI